MRSLPGNPYDGHTLPEAIEQVSILTAQKPKSVFVDKGYRGVSVDGVTIWRSGQKRGVILSIRKAIHRRSAVEPAIGHMKNEGKLRGNWLKGSLGDAVNAGTIARVRHPKERQLPQKSGSPHGFSHGLYLSEN